MSIVLGDRVKGNQRRISGVAARALALFLVKKKIVESGRSFPALTINGM
jgi:hypothetical protein